MGLLWLLPAVPPLDSGLAEAAYDALRDAARDDDPLGDDDRTRAVAILALLIGQTPCWLFLLALAAVAG